MRDLEVTLPYRSRAQFKPFHRTNKRWSCIVAHRRAGKTVACVNRLLKSALQCPLPNPRTAYIAPYLKQAKDVAWTYLKEAAGPLMAYGASINESELRIDLPNGGRVRIYGADNAEALRGIYLDDVVLDEYADMSPKVMPEIIRPALSDRQGRAVFIGTPKGRNEFCKLFETAKTDERWFALMLKASETGLVRDEELADARAMMSPEQYQQEYECSFQAAVVGSYYGTLLDEAERAGRITRVPYEPAKPVETWWDLGVGDSTAIWFVQRVNAEIRVIDCYEMTGEGLPHYAKVLAAKPYVYNQHIAPFDIGVRELGSGKTRIEMARELGVKFDIAPKIGPDDGINAVRMMLPKCWFDADACKGGLEALRQYRKEFDDKLKAFRDRPLHDWTSHYADAFRYGAVARQALEASEEEDEFRHHYGSGGWMGA